MDAILFSANPSMVTVDDAIRHLSNHDELYWEVGFRITGKQVRVSNIRIYAYQRVASRVSSHDS